MSDSKANAIKETLQDCQTILDLTVKKVENFLAGKVEGKYGSTALAEEVAKETGLTMFIVAPIVSAYIKRDPRVESNRGRHHGGLRATGVVE